MNTNSKFFRNIRFILCVCYGRQDSRGPNTPQGLDEFALSLCLKKMVMSTQRIILLLLLTASSFGTNAFDEGSELLEDLSEKSNENSLSIQFYQEIQDLLPEGFEVAEFSSCLTKKKKKEGEQQQSTEIQSSPKDENDGKRNLQLGALIPLIGFGGAVSAIPIAGLAGLASLLPMSAVLGIRMAVLGGFKSLFGSTVRRLPSIIGNIAGKGFSFGSVTDKIDFGKVDFSKLFKHSYDGSLVPSMDTINVGGLECDVLEVPPEMSSVVTYEDESSAIVELVIENVSMDCSVSIGGGGSDNGDSGIALPELESGISIGSLIDKVNGRPIDMFEAIKGNRPRPFQNIRTRRPRPFSRWHRGRKMTHNNNNSNEEVAEHDLFSEEDQGDNQSLFQATSYEDKKLRSTKATRRLKKYYHKKRDKHAEYGSSSKTNTRNIALAIHPNSDMSDNTFGLTDIKIRSPSGAIIAIDVNSKVSFVRFKISFFILNRYTFLTTYIL